MMQLEPPAYYVGLMSGTSLDGVDAALIGIRGNHIQLLAFATYPLADKLKEPILRLNAPGFDEIDALGMLDKELGVVFAHAALAIINKAGLSAGQITAIGSHGQTLRHRPQGLANSLPYTLQIGCAATIAEQTGITTVSDFRRRDIAAGGQGAPLVPFIHQQLFADSTQAVAVLNIGGIANVSYLGANEEALGFDTGPGNMLMDSLMQTMSDARFAYDKDGELAASGHVCEPLLQQLLHHAFFKQIPPRSTGREDFGAAMTDTIMGFDISDADKMATACELTAQSIQQSFALLPAQPSICLLCGGGVHNQVLRQRLAELLAPCTIASTQDFGVPPDAVEAVAFAVLAAYTLKGEPNTLSAVTGATHNVCGGQITPGNNWKNIFHT